MPAPTSHPPAIPIALTLLVLLAPLPIGLVTAEAWSIWVLLTAVLLLVWGGLVALGRVPMTVRPTRLLAPGILYAAVVTWALVQTTPVGGLTHPLWTSAAEALGRAVTPAVSLAPADTRDGVLRLAAYAAIFWLGVQVARHGRTADQIFSAIALATAAYVLYGVVVSFTGLQGLALYERTLDGRFSGPLVNPNNFATLCGLGLVAATARLYDGFREAALGIETAKERRRLKIEYMANRGWPYAAAWVVLITGLLLAQSRGGFLATMLALTLFFPLLALAQTQHRRNAWMAGGLAAGALVIFITLSGGQLVDRLGPEAMTDEAGSRGAVYAVVLRAIADAPLEGFGLGAFQETFRLYQPADMRGIYAMAHNTYLENALELGVPAAAALTLAVVWLAGRCLRGTFRRRTRRALPCAGVAACALVGAHATVDFSLQIPGVTAVFALLLAVSVAQSWSSRGATGLA